MDTQLGWGGGGEWGVRNTRTDSEEYASISILPKTWKFGLKCEIQTKFQNFRLWRLSAPDHYRRQYLWIFYQFLCSMSCVPIIISLIIMWIRGIYKEIRLLDWTMLLFRCRVYTKFLCIVKSFSVKGIRKIFIIFSGKKYGTSFFTRNYILDYMFKKGFLTCLLKI